MPKSLTGFGRATVVNSLGSFNAEVVALNRKHLEVIVALPPELALFEPEVRQWVGHSISRGRVQVSLTACFEKMEPYTVSANRALAKGLKKAWDELTTELGLEEPFRLDSVRSVNLFTMEQAPYDEEATRQALHEVLHKALEQALEAKIKEGTNLGIGLLNRLELINNHLKNIEAIRPKATEEASERVKKLMPEWVTAQYDEAALLQAICLVVQRSDITEEIVRLHSHCDQLRALLHQEKEPIGKRGDFLIQEMLREVNTLGAKAETTSILHLSLEIKVELEKMREQIQNVE